MSTEDFVKDLATTNGGKVDLEALERLSQARAAAAAKAAAAAREQES